MCAGIFCLVRLRYGKVLEIVLGGGEEACTQKLKTLFGAKKVYMLATLGRRLKIALILTGPRPVAAVVSLREKR